MAAPLASAQTPDIRDVPPVVMLVIDTSGSMERRTDCICQTVACHECDPICSVAGGTFQKNRWVTLLEALTGSFVGYSCSRQERVGGAYAGAYDEGYFIPHFAFSYSSQNNDGILDIYDARVKFGLMTFDATGTHADRNPLMTATAYAALGAARQGPKGDFSYGRVKSFTFPNCGEPHAMDNGVRRASTDPVSDFVPGGLVRPGPDGAYSGETGSNLAIQTALLDPRLRPFGATPIAGALDDLDYFFQNDPSVLPAVTPGDGRDPYFACRDRYAILITDGYPNADMRGEPVYCEAVGGCPYDTAQNLASQLAAQHVRGVYVVGFDQHDPHARPLLEAIAEAGQTEEPLWADDLPGLRAALSEILDRAAPGTTTRTVPALSSVSSSTLASLGPRLAMLQVTSGFKLGSEAVGDRFEPWSGVLERRRFECNGIEVEERDIGPQDRFHELLNQQALTSRRLLTVIPPNGTGAVTTHFRGDGATELAARGGGLLPTADASYATPVVHQVTSMTPFTTADIPPEVLSAPGGLHEETILNMHAGLSTVPRFGKAMGAIYHSSPVIVPPPTIQIDDEGYNAYSQSRLLTGNLPVSERPRVIYVSTIEGVIHAFLADDFSHGSIGTYSAGHELWGFIPPMFLKQLHQNLNSSPQFTDGTPVVREIFDARTDAQIGNEAPFRTVLVTGMRAGGPGYVALDVTDPFEPKFLWQFYDESRLGPTYAEPAIAQVRVNGVSRGVVILPGGQGQLRQNGGPAACNARRPPASQNANPGRPQRRCWEEKGRSLFVVDAATGVVLRQWDHRDLDAPITGGVSVFNGQTAAIATRAFFTDADGMMFRLDMTKDDPKDWKLEPFFDLYQFSNDPAAGRPAIHPPVISTDEAGNVVILAATGNIDVLTDTTAQNVVVSLTEVNVSSSPIAQLNWMIQLDPGELVTGPLELFSGQVFFGVFQPASNPANLCLFGYSRLFGVDYVKTSDPLNTSSTDPAGILPPLGDPSEPKRVFYGPSDLPELENTILTGLRVAARPNCAQGLDVDTNVYPVSQQGHRVAQVGASQYQLVGQLAGAAGRAGGAIGEMRVDLPPPSGMTHAQAFAGSVD